MNQWNPFSFGRHRVGRVGWSTYFTLRTFLMVIAFLLPLVFWFGGEWFDNLPLQGSISAYYHAGGGALRDVFVGSIVGEAALLIVYKGFSGFENWALNIGGIGLIIVALVPDDGSTALSARLPWLHVAAAVTFFLCVFYVAIFRASDTLTLFADVGRRRYYRRRYNVVAAGMFLTIGAAALIACLTDIHRLVFFLEAGGVWAFAGFWYVKTREMRESRADLRAGRQELRRGRYGLRDAFRPIPVMPRS